MSTWHYRLIKHIYPKGEVYYSVHEYYPATEEVGEAWTLSPVALWGEDPDDIQWCLVQVLNDINKHSIIEVKHDDYGVVHAENTGSKPCAMCGDKIEPLLERIKELEQLQFDCAKSPYDLFEKELRRLINCHSLENRTDTPDYILATYIVEYLKSLERLHRAKSDHEG